MSRDEWQGHIISLFSIALYHSSSGLGSPAEEILNFSDLGASPLPRALRLVV